MEIEPKFARNALLDTTLFAKIKIDAMNALSDIFPITFRPSTISSGWTAVNPVQEAAMALKPQLLTRQRVVATAQLEDSLKRSAALDKMNVTDALQDDGAI